MGQRHHKKRKSGQWRPQSLKLVATQDKLTASAGLGTIVEVFDQTWFGQAFARCLPERTSHRSLGSYRLGLTLIASLIHGHECLDDLDRFRNDPHLSALFKGETAAARTHGDFLRDFEQEHIEKLNQFLNTMSRAIFEQLKEVQPAAHKPKEMVIDMDSTPHEQHANKMEGLAWNYKNMWCLDSQVAFNSLGFSHGFQLRSGNTKSGVNAAELIEQCFQDDRTQEQRKRQAQDYFRADSAYCYKDVIEACLKKGVFFSITANDATTSWKSQMEEEPLVWKPWVYSKADLEKAEARGIELAEVELARYHWRPSWAKGMLVFPIVIKRTWKREKETRAGTQGDLFHAEALKQEGFWEHYAVATNLPLQSWSLQEVMAFHQKRGNAENFIREEKYGFDLKHFPCQKLIANHAYGLMAQIAHNLLRWMALLQRPDKPHYSKKLRNQFIFVPGKIVKTARQVFLKMMDHNLKEVLLLKQALQLSLNQPAYSTG